MSKGNSLYPWHQEKRKPRKLDPSVVLSLVLCVLFVLAVWWAMIASAEWFYWKWQARAAQSELTP